MQGPFTPALNAALYDAWSIRAMVSKDSGEPGGVTGKGAARAGAGHPGFDD
jgi:precorrin-6x reductase